MINLNLLSAPILGRSKFKVLPQYLLTDPGTLYEGFEAQADWTNEAGSHADNAVEFLSGTKSQQVTSLSGSNGRIKKGVNWDLSSFGRFLGYVYIHDAITDYTGSAIVYLSNEAAQTNSFRGYLTTNRFTAGWNIIAIDQAEFAVVAGAPSWASPIQEIAVVVTGASGKTVHASWDKFFFGLRGMPAIAIGFDDGKAVQYSTCFPYMQAHNIVGSMFVPTAYVGDAGYVTAAQLLEMQAAGWTIGNHTQNHTDLTTLTEAQQETEISAATADYAAMGITDGPDKYLCYVGGNYNADTLTAMTNLGILTGRTVYGHTNMGSNKGLPADLNKLSATTIASTPSLATVEGYIDTAITRGDLLILTFHEVGAAGQMTVADFQALIDYIVTKKNQISAVTFDEIYRLSLGPVMVRKIFRIGRFDGQV